MAALSGGTIDIQKAVHAGSEAIDDRWCDCRGERQAAHIARRDLLP